VAGHLHLLPRIEGAVDLPRGALDVGEERRALRLDLRPGVRRQLLVDGFEALTQLGQGSLEVQNDTHYRSPKDEDGFNDIGCGP